MVQARELALDVLRPRLDQVVKLGAVAAGSGLVTEHLLRSTIAHWPLSASLGRIDHPPEGAAAILQLIAVGC